MQVGQHHALHHLVATTTGAEATLTETTYGEKTTDERKGDGRCGMHRPCRPHPSVVQGEELQHNRAVLYTGMAR